MTKQIEIKQNSWVGGVSDDPRENTSNGFRITKHFDIFSNPNRLIPYRSFENDANNGSSSTGMKQYYVRDFLYASSSSKLYGLGQTAGGNTKIVYKLDATSGNWTLPANSEGDSAVINGCFIEYKDYLWGFQGTNKVFKWGLLSGVPSITNSVNTTGATITSVAQGLIARDDNLYLPYNNKLGRVTSSGTYNDAVLTLPTNFKITSIANFGNYLAIGCSPISTYNGVSKVFLWNLTSPDVQEVIDWGEGELRVLENIEGMLVGVTDRYLNNSTGAGTGSMIIQGYTGGYPQVLKEVFTTALTGTIIPLSKTVKNNRLFFAVKIMKNEAGTQYHEGIWSFGRKNVKYPWSLSMDYFYHNVKSFGSAGNYFFIADSTDGNIKKTNDEEVFTYPSHMESQIYNFGDSTLDKRLDSIKVSFKKIESGNTLSVSYIVDDDDNTWDSVGTFNTVGAISYTFLMANGANFKTGKEFQFRIESTGGLEVTSVVYTATLLNTV